ncbi:MAG: redox-sensing transcriptional repressor Rex [Firmicutes bacterium]|nr:redox-sensing transcriptional repressor Rex [Bacillota bacterium]
MEKKIISGAVIKRLPRYYNCLKELSIDGIQKISSNVISEKLNVTASQVRQDFSNFGEFGQQGYGYDVEYLKNQMAKILGLNKEYSAIIIGGGNIGKALANYQGFKSEGFNILAVFDICPENIKLKNIPVLNIDKLKEYLQNNKIDICIIATDKENAKEAANKVIKFGVNAIWNFAPVELYFGDNVAVENINMSASLFMLTYNMKSRLKN